MLTYLNVVVLPYHEQLAFFKHLMLMFDALSAHHLIAYEICCEHSTIIH